MYVNKKRKMRNFEGVRGMRRNSGGHTAYDWHTPGISLLLEFSTELPQKLNPAVWANCLSSFAFAFAFAYKSHNHLHSYHTHAELVAT